MINGFYDIRHFKVGDVEAFCRDALPLSYLVKGETKYKKSSHREVDETISLDYMLKKISAGIGDFGTDTQPVEGSFAVVDRNVYHRMVVDRAYEVCLHNSDWEFLYIYLNADNFDSLINKYGLKLRNY